MKKLNWLRVLVVCSPFVIANLVVWCFVATTEEPISQGISQKIQLMRQNIELKQQVNDLNEKIRAINFYHEGPLPTVIDPLYSDVD